MVNNKIKENKGMVRKTNQDRRILNTTQELWLNNKELYQSECQRYELSQERYSEDQKFNWSQELKTPDLVVLHLKKKKPRAKLKLEPKGKTVKSLIYKVKADKGYKCLYAKWKLKRKGHTCLTNTCSRSLLKD